MSSWDNMGICETIVVTAPYSQSLTISEEFSHLVFEMGFYIETHEDHLYFVANNRGRLLAFLRRMEVKIYSATTRYRA